MSSRKRQLEVKDQLPKEVDQGGQQKLVFAQQIVARSGPLPEPEILREYENLLPGAADRIFLIAERDQTFQITRILRQQKADNWTVRLGQIFGFLLGALAISGAFLLAMNDKPISGATMFIGAVATLIGAAVWSTNNDPKKPPTSQK